MRTIPCFISRRRRHTRLQGDWSSDVCSSDLVLDVKEIVLDLFAVLVGNRRVPLIDLSPTRNPRFDQVAVRIERDLLLELQIGRASCRERWSSAAEEG